VRRFIEPKLRSHVPSSDPPSSPTFHRIDRLLPKCVYRIPSFDASIDFTHLLWVFHKHRGHLETPTLKVLPVSIVGRAKPDRCSKGFDIWSLTNGPTCGLSLPPVPFQPSPWTDIRSSGNAVPPIMANINNRRV
jgi:hypothetical protein